MSKQKNSNWYRQENKFTPKSSAGILTQAIQKKNSNILIFPMPHFLKEPITIHIGNLILVILVTPMMFQKRFGSE